MSLLDKMKQHSEDKTVQQSENQNTGVISEQKSETSSKSGFRSRIEFDTNNLLDPRVCNGESLAPNILLTLGVNKKIVENPAFMFSFRSVLDDILEQKGTGITWLNFKTITKEQIGQIVEAIKSSEILTEEDRKKYYSSVGSKYHGIKIDPHTGFITIQRILCTEYELIVGEIKYSTANLQDTEIGLIADDTEYRAIRTKSVCNERLSSINSFVFNPDGIEMKYEMRIYDDETGSIHTHTTMERNPEYPFYARKTFMDDDTIFNFPDFRESELPHFYDIDLTGGRRNSIDLMRDSLYENDKMLKRLRDVTFSDEEYRVMLEEKKKEVIENFLNPEVVRGRGIDREKIVAGIRKLGIKAGIITQRDIDEYTLSL